MARNGGFGHLPILPHSEWNQAEYPWPTRTARAAREIQAESPRTNYGILTVLPYHLEHTGLMGATVTWVYPLTGVVYEKGYPSEAFLRMQPEVTKPHPSGLSDDAPLYLSRLLRGA